jgi:uncharacterized protein (TIGR01244 family)
MDSIFRGDLESRRGRANAWADSLLVDHALLRLAWRNFSVVAPGRLYRSNHPTPGRLAAQVRQLGIRTLINLRGECNNGSDALSREAARRLGVAFFDAPLRSREAPPRERVQHLMGIFAAMQEPALVHCKSGADRAGFASALFLVAQGVPVRVALGQLSVWHGHLPGSGAGVLRAFFLRYAAEAEGRLSLGAWVDRDYDPESLRAGFVARRGAALVADRVLRRE